ncbi:hypothetical protein ColLi_00974 [Colletotrichum liriopes]|uniref:Uncharacterized protein n=1 Tax=Colletotrichum liriopes TaxID=708192 RepID=A0AA37GC11_9PEZI|nr:hypothetical protein ColLi_00974 [Colletotrichum liriopes]
MKVPTTTFLLPVSALVFRGIATAWQLPSFQNPLVSSWLVGGGDASPGIPQFILHAGHPWLSAHADELSQLSDPASFLCAPIDTPFPRHDLRGKDPQLSRGLNIPADLFHKLTLRNHCAIFSCDRWERAYDRLVEMKACPRAIEEARWLRAETYLANSTSGDLGTESKHLRIKQLAALFVDVLGSMKGLKELDWVMKGSASRDVEAAIAKAFSDSGAELRSVERSTTSTKSPWRWIVTILDENVDIEELWVGSTASFPFYAEDGKLLRELVEDLSALQNLKELHLPRSLELQLGFQNGRHLCADYHVVDERSDETIRSKELQGAKATERAGEAIREAFPRLERLYVGDYCGNVTTDAEGIRLIAWDWTGRMEAWLANAEPKWAIPKRYMKDEAWKTFAQ